MRITLSILVFLLLFSCKKAKLIEIEFTTVKITSNYSLNDCHFLDDNLGFISGGNENKGVVFKTVNGGSTWNLFNVSSISNAYSIHFLDENFGFIGSADTRLYRTYDGGETWVDLWWKEGELSFHEHNRTSIDRFQFLDDSNGYFVGGDTFNNGQVYRTKDRGENWTFDTLKHEINGLYFTSKNKGLICGHGYVGSTSNGQDFIQTEMPNGNYVAIQKLNNGKIICAENTGKIYQGDGNIFERTHKFGQYQFLDMKFKGNIGFIVGANGLLLKSSDYGEHWSRVETSISGHIRSISYKNSNFYACSSSGELLIIPT